MSESETDTGTPPSVVAEEIPPVDAVTDAVMSAPVITPAVVDGYDPAKLSLAADETPPAAPELSVEPQHPDIKSFESMSVSDFVQWMKDWVHWKLNQ